MARHRDAIVAFADELLEVEAYPEYGRPGLQVVGADEVSKLVCGVSCSKELFERAGARGAQMVLVHHGLFWRNEPLVVDRRLKGRLEALFAGEPDAARVPPRARRASGGRQQRAARRAARRETRGRVRPDRRGGTARRAHRHRRAVAATRRGDRPRAARLRRGPGAHRADRRRHGRRRHAADRGRSRGLRRARHGRAGGAGPAHGARARHPFPRGRPLRDRDVRRAGARGAARRRVRARVGVRRPPESRLASPTSAVAIMLSGL